MPERQVISNTSPLLYLHQVQRLEILRKLYDVVTIPKAVEQELAQGKQHGLLQAVRPVIEDLRKTSMHMHEDLVRLVLVEAGEERSL